MSGPCLCGDPYCPSCGSPGQAKLEAAYEAATDAMINYKLSPDEVAVFAKIGLEAALAFRTELDRVIQERAALEQEAKMYEGTS